jgi:hypothetical protein
MALGVEEEVPACVDEVEIKCMHIPIYIHKFVYTNINT